jgi:hypothetical protein
MMIFNADNIVLIVTVGGACFEILSKAAAPVLI